MDAAGLMTSLALIQAADLSRVSEVSEVSDISASEAQLERVLLES
jgi:hypothetical protein